MKTEHVWRYRVMWFVGLLIFLLYAGALGSQSNDPAKTIRDDAAIGNAVAVWLDVDGVIGPAVHDYLQRSFAKAQAQQARVIILRINTPGGLDVSMRDIIQDIIASPVPIVGYVAPGGARAASAGTYILYASHIAAMAPATNLGAATPVKIGGLPQLPDPTKGKPADQSDELPMAQDDVMTRKIVNDAVAYIRGLAQMRARNADWAEQAVRAGASLTAGDALKENVIDLIATDLDDLLIKIDGRSVSVSGQAVTLMTKNLRLMEIEPDWRTRLLAVITDPSIAYILMLIGIYGLILEFANPGTIVAGVIGTISLLLALFAFQVLPVNYAGMALILLGITFMLAEAFAPSFGALGLGGITAFAIGSVMLIDTDIPGYGVSLPLIATFTLMSAGVCILILGMALKARKGPAVTGSEQMLHSVGEVMEGFDHEGWVRVHGEQWRAHTRSPLQVRQQVRVTAIHGLLLEVEPWEANNIAEN
ncbi:MAG: nodulation protein NfeD [Nitrosomonas sp.]|nr:nodulation protein NfeD [Nitrosomonas sp.]